MLNKLLDLGKAILYFAIFVSLVVVTFEPLFREDMSLWHFYVRLFLSMFGVCTFAILRLYNSIVQNTRFTIKLRESVGKLHNALTPLGREMKTLSNGLHNVKRSADSLEKTFTNSADRTEKVIEKLNRITKNA